jgi:hypothetical protein
VDMSCSSHLLAGLAVADSCCQQRVGQVLWLWASHGPRPVMLWPGWVYMGNMMMLPDMLWHRMVKHVHHPLLASVDTAARCLVVLELSICTGHNDSTAAAALLSGQ